MKTLLMPLMGKLLAGSMFFITSCSKTDIDTHLLVAEKAERGVQKQYQAILSQLNNSGVTGVATLTLNGTTLTVQIDAMGLEPNKVHPQHIHGFMSNTRNSTCPTMSADMNGDGLVDLIEGLPSYGPVLLNLEPMPTADANGEIHYTQTFTISQDLLPLQNRAIVLHGLTVNGEYMPTLPVACGQLRNFRG